MPARKLKTTPRKRPTQERSREMVETILQATARVLVKDGFERTTTNRVAEAAGVSVGSLYQYFPSKEALVATLVERHVDEIMAMFRGAVTALAGASIEVATRRMVGLLLEAHAVAPRLHRVFFEQVPRTGRLAK